MRPLRGVMNGYDGLDEPAEAMRGGKICPLCGEPMSRQARFCASCTPRFKNFLCAIYKRDVRTARPPTPAGDLGTVRKGRQGRQQTLAALRDNGPMSTPALARAVGMTPEGVRGQLKRLGAEGSVSCARDGRRHVWTANEKD